MYTDKFIKLPIRIYNHRQAELSGDEDGSAFETFTKINPMEIIMYHPSFDKNSEPEAATTVTIKGGDFYIILIPIDEFEKKINNFMNAR